MAEQTDAQANFAPPDTSNNEQSGDNDFKRNFQRGRGGRGGGRGRGRFFGGGDRQFKRDDDNQDGQQRYGGFKRHQDGQDDGSQMEGGGKRYRPRGPDDKIHERLNQLMGPTYDLPPVDVSEKKFNGRNRLYIGNVGAEITDEDLEGLFKPYGEVAEVFINKEKNFGFVKLDYHSNAEKAKRELDGTVLKSRNLKIRFAPNTASIKVKNLTPMVSNELLQYAFSVFGETLAIQFGDFVTTSHKLNFDEAKEVGRGAYCIVILIPDDYPRKDVERAVVCVDERGRPTGEGIVDFSKKGSAMFAVKKCGENCFFLTSSLRPCIVETYEHIDSNDGYSEKSLPKKNVDYHNERGTGPRLAQRGSFEEEFGTRWKQLYDLHATKKDALLKELELEKEKLDAQMEYARYEQETEALRSQLRAREMSKEQQKREWEFKQRQVEQERMRAEEMMRRSQEDMESRILRQQEDIKRRPDESSLYMQAHNLDSLMDKQEKAYDTPAPPLPQDYEPTEDSSADAFSSSYMRSNITRHPAENGGVWVTDSSRQKRRRY